MAALQPNYTAYTVIKRADAEDFWLAIGAAWLHQDGDGLNVILQALPIDGKVVLRLPKAEKSETDRAQQTVREENDRRKSTRRDK